LVVVVVIVVVVVVVVVSCCCLLLFFVVCCCCCEWNGEIWGFNFRSIDRSSFVLLLLVVWLKINY